MVAKRPPLSAAVRFVLMVGVMSLFADCTYEGLGAGSAW